MWNDLNGLHVCVNAVIGKCGMIWMVYMYVWML
jgi:hypothetical protein